MEIATSPSDSTTLFFCPMCQSVYKEPKILPCLHSFCRPCLVDAVSHKQDSTAIVCPLCSHEASLPSNGIAGVPDNVFLNRACQDYVSEVQSTLVAQSRARMGSATSSIEGHAGQRLSVDRGPASGQSTATALEAIRNMSRLQTKVMSLQGDALRVTYAIDQVNQHVLEWQQHKEDLKRAVQRRSSQFQFFIKRMEQQLLSQIDGKQAEDDFYAETEKSKSKLRDMLRNILHQVSVLKSVQELGKDCEINALSAKLLGKSVGMCDVALKKFHFHMETPSTAMEELVAENFANIILVSDKSCCVFIPEIRDFTNVPVGSLTGTSGEAGLSCDSTEGQQNPVLNYEEFEKAMGRVSKKRSSDRRSRRHNTDLGLDKEDVREYLAQLQTARESFRTRRQEILAQGQKAREDREEDIRRRPRSSSRKGRVQSLDRVPPDKPNMTTGKQQPEHAAVDHSSKFQYGGGHHVIPEDITLPSPVIEEISLPSSPQRQLVKQTSDPRYTHDLLSSPEEASAFDVSPPAHNLSLMEQLRNRRFSNPTTSLTARLYSDQATSLFSADHVTFDTHAHDRSSSRPLRRAISGATDRKSKIEFLRENWQKRKEILIQNEAFITADSLPAKLIDIKVKSPLQTPKDGQSPVEKDAPHQISTEKPAPDGLQKMELTTTQSHEDKQVNGVVEEPTHQQTLIPADKISDTHTRMTSSQPGMTTAAVSTLASINKDSNTTSPKEGKVTTTSSSSSSSTLTARASNTKIQSPTIARQHSSTLKDSTTSAITRTTATRESRYSKHHSQPTENIDVAALIAAMYSGNEKSIIQPSLTSSQASSTATITATTNTRGLYSTRTTSATVSAAATTTVTTTTLPVTAATTTSYTRGLYSTRTTLATVSAAATTTNHTTEHSPTVSTTPYTNQTPKSEDTSLESQTSKVTESPPRSHESRRQRYGLGNNRRHTIEIGRDAIRSARLAMANDETIPPTPLPPIPDSPVVIESSPPLILPHSQLLDRLRATKQDIRPPIASARSHLSDEYNLKDTTIVHTISARGVTTKTIPFPLVLQPVADEGDLDQSSITEAYSSIAMASARPQSPAGSMSPSPTSPTANEVALKGRVRELARKKKERWRHLTIH